MSSKLVTLAIAAASLLMPHTSFAQDTSFQSPGITPDNSPVFYEQLKQEMSNSNWRGDPIGRSRNGALQRGTSSGI